MAYRGANFARNKKKKSVEFYYLYPMTIEKTFFYSLTLFEKNCFLIFDPNHPLFYDVFISWSNLKHVRHWALCAPSVFDHVQESIKSNFVGGRQINRIICRNKLFDNKPTTLHFDVTAGILIKSKCGLFLRPDINARKMEN